MKQLWLDFILRGSGLDLTRMALKADYVSFEKGNKDLFLLQMKSWIHVH